MIYREYSVSTLAVSTLIIIIVDCVEMTPDHNYIDCVEMTPVVSPFATGEPGTFFIIVLMIEYNLLFIRG